MFSFEFFLGGFLLRKKQAIRPSLTLIRFPRFAQSSGRLRRGYYPCHGLKSKTEIKPLYKITPCNKLKAYPTITIPKTQIAIKIVKSFGFTALLNITTLGKLNVVTAIIKLKTTPSKAPFSSRLSAIGMQPKISE